MKRPVRVRFAPSPTGTLHIGGIRTALYNYLFAKKHGGAFILRIEDTDQTRYVAGAEAYIIESLRWTGLIPDEGVGFGGDLGPYRQSERKDLYRKYAELLVQNGAAYLAFDTPESLEALRAETPNFTYNHSTRGSLFNSLNLSKAELDAQIKSGTPYVVRLKFEPGERIAFHDHIRGDVSYSTDDLDDKVLFKADGMPTYHLANVVDDYLMQISHVIRGEEWLSSTPHHVALYKGFGWLDQMPEFVHLPLILKPEGNGKLSKRDGAKFGFPVFPLAWQGDTPEDSAPGFRETGFLPEALINFLALLGWHPSDDQEIFDITDLIQSFDLEQISKGGARFDYEKAKWFNQKYLIEKNNSDIAADLLPIVSSAGYQVTPMYLEEVVRMMKERVATLPEFVHSAPFLFSEQFDFDVEQVKKRWSTEKTATFTQLVSYIFENSACDAVTLEQGVKTWLTDHNHKPGDYLPLLRLSLAGTMSGPGVFDMIKLLGPEKTKERQLRSLDFFQAQI
jgi:glutamyl-tRNA synthetase